MISQNAKSIKRDAEEKFYQVVSRLCRKVVELILLQGRNEKKNFYNLVVDRLVCQSEKRNCLPI